VVPFVKAGNPFDDVGDAYLLTAVRESGLDRITDRSGLPYQLTPMGTILEGEWDETFAVVKACFDQLRASGCTRIGVHLKVDWRDGPAGRLQAKTAKVEQVLGRRLRT